MNCKIKNIEVIIKDSAILPDLDNYYIDATSEFDLLWYKQKESLLEMIVNLLNIQPSDAGEYFTMAPYHNGVKCFWIFVYKPEVLKIDLFRMLTYMAEENNCYYMLDCDLYQEPNHPIGQIAISHKYIVFGMLSDDKKLPDLCGIIE